LQGRSLLVLLVLLVLLRRCGVLATRPGAGGPWSAGHLFTAVTVRRVGR